MRNRHGSSGEARSQGKIEIEWTAPFVASLGYPIVVAFAVALNDELKDDWNIESDGQACQGTRTGADEFAAVGETQLAPSSEDALADGVPDDEVGVAKLVGAAAEPLEGSAEAVDVTAAWMGRAE